MPVEISSIKNETLRHAAEVADLNDNTANSGKLDQNELSVFIKEAVNSDCDKSAIAQLCGMVGVEHASDDVKASMEKLNQLQKLEKELKYQKSILRKRNDEIGKLEREESDSSKKERNRTLAFFGGGAVAGALAGAALGSSFFGVGAVPGALIGGIAGAIGGGIVNNLTSKPTIDNYEKIRSYEDQKTPIENKISELESQMRDIQETL